MKIIIEGCDGSGKSTLAKQLAKIFDCRIEHDSKPCTYGEYIERLAQDGNVIFDRFFVGQFIYNKPEERKLTHIELNNLENFCKVNGIIMLYMNTDVDLILDRLARRSEEEKSKDREIIAKTGYDSQEAFVKGIKKLYDDYTRGVFTYVSKGDVEL